jgi:hypothetical protein
MWVETRIAKLTADFVQEPLRFFHEKELHGRYYALCRHESEEALTRDDVPVHLFRHEYNSVYHYVRERKNPLCFTAAYTGEQGKPVAIDFALLKRIFVERHDYLTVMNKDKLRRSVLWRDEPMDPGDGRSVALQKAIEFKMAHVRTRMDVSQGALNALSREMVIDCRKLGFESPVSAYVLGFSHGPRPDAADANSIIDLCVQAYDQTYRGPGTGDIRVLVATPTAVCLRGNWVREAWENQLPAGYHLSWC